jgi:ferredoxin-NADP reductase/predicted pyridoxine 5'-phosphate oxidase superfamily flavin-nucleotide-binding protein
MRKVMERFSKQVIANFLPEQHREFYQQLPFILLGHADQNDWPWATILCDEPGFITSEDNKKLTIHSNPVNGDPFSTLLAQEQYDGTRIGLLGIELSTRRRNRMAAHITQIKNNSIELEIDQAFGNCPQYIQTRKHHKVDDALLDKAETHPIDELNEETRALIQNSDTFFVASYIKNETGDVSEGVDVSHRGGKPGFVRVDKDGTLTIPDYLGNYHFNTLGNFLINPKAGLLFPDFENGHLLSLTGTVEILWDSEETKYFEGAERLWRFKPDHGFWMKNALPLRWTLDKVSPNTNMTGTWQEAENKRQAEEERNQWQTYSVTTITDESSVIKSFILTSENKQRPSFISGQFLTLKANINNQETIRTYTISSSPHDDDYRISVKREGTFSSYLHDMLQVGDTLQVKAATGDFTFDAQEERPVVLIAAGVGITPMISMARFSLLESIRTRSPRKLTFIHSAHDKDQRAFFNELKEIENNSSGNIRCFWALSKIDDSLEPYKDFNLHGRISKKFLNAILPLDDYDFYLCGPTGFMQATYDILRELGVNDTRIMAESFGPASLLRQNDQSSSKFEQMPVADEAIIEFTKSKVKQAWTKNDGTLLEFAEAHGIHPEYGCRSGQCGSCKVKLKSGKVSYNQPLQTTVNNDEVLLCCAMPAATFDNNMIKIKIDI